MSNREALDVAVEEIKQRTGLVVESIGGGCPFQADGSTPDGQRFYFRYRHDEATLYVWPPSEDGRKTDRFSDATYYSEKFNAMDADYDRGDLDADEAVALICELWDTRRDRSTFENTGIGRLSMEVQALSAAMRGKPGAILIVNFEKVQRRLGDAAAMAILDFAKKGDWYVDMWARMTCGAILLEDGEYVTVARDE